MPLPLNEEAKAIAREGRTRPLKTDTYNAARQSPTGRSGARPGHRELERAATFRHDSRPLGGLYGGGDVARAAAKAAAAVAAKVVVVAALVVVKISSTYRPRGK